MAEGFALADAFVRIRPDSAGFRAEMTSQIKAAMAGFTPTVPVGANTNPAKVAIAAFNAYAKAFLREQSVKVTTDTTGAKAAIAALASQLALLTRKTYSLQVAADDAGLQAKLARIALQLRALTATVAKPRLTLLQYEQVQAQMLALLASLEKINSTISTAHINVDDATAEQRLALLSINLANLVNKARDIRVGLTDAGQISAINELIAAMGRLGDRVATIDFNAINLDALTMSEEDLQTLDETLGKAFPAAIAQAGFAWRGWATLTQRIPLFGGRFLSGTLGAIAVWHLLADSIIEVAAVLIPAGIAFGAFAAAAGPATTSVVNHMKAVLTVTQATAQAVPPFTNAFHQLSTAITPHVYELFGQVMSVVNSRMGAFAQLAQAAGQVMDYFGARIERAITSSNFEVFLKHAISDLTGLGDLIGNILGIIGNLIHAVAGVAEVLLHVLVDITGAIERFTGSGIVIFLTRWALAFHGAWIWAGLTATAILQIIPLLARLTGGISAATAEASGFARIRLAMTDLANNTGVLGVKINNIIPAIRNWSARMVTAGGAAEDAGRGTKLLSGLIGVGTTYWPVFAAAAAIALGVVVYFTLKAKTATEQWISSLQQAIDKNLTWFNGLTVSSSALSKVNKALADSQAATVAATTYTSKYGITIGQIGQTLTGQIQRTNDLSTAQKTFGDQANLIGFRLGTLATRFGGLTAAMGYARLAGIKINDLAHAQGSAWQNDLTQIQGLIQGYKYMGVAQGALGNAVKALQVTTDDQISAVQQLNQAWTTMLGIVAGGETTFVTFAQQTISVSQAMSGLNSSLTTTNGVATSTISPTGRLNENLTKAAKAANAASTNINGLNQSSLQYRQSLGTLISDAQSYYEALQTQSAAATDAGRGQQLLSRAGQYLLSILIPATRGSATLRNEVFLLGQQFGFTRTQMDQFGRNSGTVKQNERALEDINNQMARSVSNVGKDWAQMATTLSGQVKAALEGVAFGASGARYAAQKLYEAVHSGNPDLATQHYWFKVLVDDLHNSGLSWSQATAEAEAYTKGLHANWQEIASGHGPRSQLIADTQATLGVTKNTAEEILTYADALRHASDQTAAGRATRLQLISDLVRTGQQSDISNTAITKLIAKILKIPTREALQLIMQATGRYSITGTSVGAGGQRYGGQGPGTTGGGAPGTGAAATGMRVPGVGNRDSFAAWLTPGEAVVPKHLVPAVAPFLGANRVPGFASGGFASTGPYTDTAAGLGNFYYGSYTTFRQTVINAMVSTLKAAIQSATQAAQGAFSVGASGATVLSWIKASLAFTGEPQSWIPALERLIQLESGGNPRAYDPISVGGQHAEGLWQMLPSTFYGEGGRGSLYNPVEEGVAALRYIAGRYGSPYNIPGLFSGQYGGYDSGGWLAPGLTMAWNGTGRYEPVGRNSDYGGGGVNVYLTIQPGAVLTGNATQIGQAIGKFILEFTKHGGKLYPAGTTIGRTSSPPGQPGLSVVTG